MGEIKFFDTSLKLDMWNKMAISVSEKWIKPWKTLFKKVYAIGKDSKSILYKQTHTIFFRENILIVNYISLALIVISNAFNL